MNITTVIDRLVRAVGVRSIRTEDAQRDELHGGTSVDHRQRTEAHARKLSERFASILGWVE